MNRRLQKTSQRGERDQAGEHAGAVNGEALEPLTEIVSFGPEDEEFVAKIGNGNIQGGSEDRCHNHREIQPTGRQNRVEQRKNERR